METPKAPKEILETLLVKLGLSVQAIHESTDPSRARRAFSVFLSDEDSAYFEPSLEEVFALERVARLLLRRAGIGDTIEIDVAGLRAGRDEKLRELVRAAAREAVRTGKPVTLYPMSGRERRVVHLELASHPEVSTESIGEGEERRVVISPLSSQAG